MQSPYESFQPFRSTVPAVSPLVSPMPSRRNGNGNGYFQDFGNVSSPNSAFQSSGLIQPSTFSPSYSDSYGNSYGNNSFNQYSTSPSGMSPYQEQSNALGFQTFQTPRRQRRQSLPARPDMNSWSRQGSSTGYGDTYSPSYSWNGNGIGSGNLKRSATLFGPTSSTTNFTNTITSPRNQMSPRSDTSFQQVSFSSPISTTFIEPDRYYDDTDYEYSTRVDGPLRRSSLSSYPSTLELHAYLSIPPFSYSLLKKPEVLMRQGYGGLHQYATRPPTSLMILQSPHLPWEIRIGGNSDKYLTVYEVLTAIYKALRESPTASEVNILYTSGDSKNKYYDVLDSYKRRWEKENPYHQDYLRKIDWLCGKNTFNGLVSKKRSGGMKGKGKAVYTILFRGKDDF